MNTQEERWKRLLIYGLMIALWALFFILSTISLIKDFAFTKSVKENYTKTTLGIIKNIRTSKTSRTTYHYYDIRFKTDNKNEYQVKNEHIGSTYKIGDTLTVRYNPKNPKESIAEDKPISYKDLFLPFLASIITFCMTLFLLLRWFIIYKSPHSSEMFTKADRFLKMPIQ